MNKVQEEKDESGVLYIYATPENEQHILDIKSKFNLKKSEIVNKIIEGHRTGKKPKFEKFVPKYVQRAENWEKQNKAE